ncbi:MAG: hypothetical protein Q8Q33_02400 [Chlamydiota bacterium]|nr:hypothetical protein [Chlamydiota bacterium]
MRIYKMMCLFMLVFLFIVGHRLFCDEVEFNMAERTIHQSVLKQNGSYQYSGDKFDHLADRMGLVVIQVYGQSSNQKYSHRTNKAYRRTTYPDIS